MANERGTGAGTGDAYVYPFLMPWSEASHRVFRDVGHFIAHCLPDD